MNKDVRVSQVRSLDEAQFESAVSTGVVLLDLWAPWCSPCQSLAPVLEDVAEDFAGTVEVCKIDVEAEQGLRARLAVSSVPTLILYRDGSEIARMTGILSRARLTTWIEERL